MQVQDNLEHILSASRNRRQHRRQPAAAAAPPVNESSILADLLLKATDKRNQELEVSVLRRIKALCRKSEEHIRAVHDYLLHALEANHAQVCTYSWVKVCTASPTSRLSKSCSASPSTSDSRLCVNFVPVQEDLS